MMRIHLIHTNDLHSHLEAAAQVDTYVNNQRNRWVEEEIVLLVDVGDHVDRARPETEGTNGFVNRAILEQMGYDVVTMGNNELVTFSRNELAAMYQHASFARICANVDDPLFRPYQCYEFNGVRLAFIGVTAWYPMLYQMLGWNVSDPFVAVRKWTEQLREQGYIIIVLSHLGYPNDVKMAKEITGIDLILGGHTHHVLPDLERVGQTTLAAAGKFGNYLGHVQLHIDEAGKLKHISGSSFALNERPSERVLNTIDFYRTEASIVLNQPIGKLKQKLLVYLQTESSLPNLLADSLVAWTGAKYGLINNGLLLYSLPAGDITKGDIHATCPHPINPVIIAIKGKALRQALEEALLEEFIDRDIHGFGFRGKKLGSLAVSGITIYYDAANAPYEKIHEIYMGKELLDDDKIYHIATASMFTIANGLGYVSLNQGEVVKQFVPETLRDVLTTGLQSEPLLQRCYQHRWISISSKAGMNDIVPEET
jgi:5'-nucleotidase